MHANPIDKQGTQKVHNQKKGENWMKPYTYEKLKRSPPVKSFRILKVHILGFGEPTISTTNLQL